MNVIIIEDESQAALRLKKLLFKIDANINVLTILESVVDSIKWLTENLSPDLIFSDIQLADDKSFLIYEQIKISCPVIFTTMFDNFAIKAFKTNGIDYLLKPIDEEELKSALQKYYLLTQKEEKNDLIQLIKQLKSPKPEYKSRFLVKYKQQLKVIPAYEIAYFYIDMQTVFFRTFNNEKYFVENPLNEVEETLNPYDFFRINRQMIINLKSIITIHDYFNDSLKIEIRPPFSSEIIVKRPKTTELKSWLDR